jgi:hypothetical protein
MCGTRVCSSAIACYWPTTTQMWSGLLRNQCGGVGKDKGVTRRHVPDLLFALSYGNFMLVDVKPAKFAEHPKAIAVFGWTARICAARAWRYEVWAGTKATVQANMRQLAAGRRRELLDDEAVEAVQAAFRPGVTIGDAESAAGRSPLGARRAVLWMLWTHQCWTDLTRPLSSDSVLLDRQPSR